MSDLPRLIPCLDLLDGRVAKGRRFEEVRRLADPVERAADYEAQGADELVVLDIGATPSGRAPDLTVVRRIADVLTIPLTVGGGVRDLDDVGRRLRYGADKVAINTAGVEDAALLARASREYGAQCVVAAVDVRECDGRWPVFVRAGTTRTHWEAVDWCAEARRRGAGELLVTSIDRDGTGGGYDLALYRAIRSRVPLPLIASGGCGSASDVVELLRSGAADAALLASRLHDGRLRLDDLRARLRAAGIPTREEGGE